MKFKESFIRYLTLTVLFLAVPAVIYLKNIPRVVDFIGVLVCGFAAGTLFYRGITLLKKK